ncbi:unnamed protein product [Eruca vesicaria subsp. sativa]|uniref:Secreted protein n=1 Tax=Eruca vesicaria subsp. sativa TaxID=29727 RepID=A0ABC8JCM1_ERUVS|nr:unnamed protein product [Eruca vesicaria subsp. sativa]
MDSVSLKCLLFAASISDLVGVMVGLNTLPWEGGALKARGEPDSRSNGKTSVGIVGCLHRRVRILSDSGFYLVGFRKKVSRLSPFSFHGFCFLPALGSRRNVFLAR